MTQIRRMADSITDEPYFRDSALGIQYRRIVGSLAWPVDRVVGGVPVMHQGCALVLAEHRKPDAEHGVRPLRVLAEVEDGSVPELLRAVAGLRDEWMATDWLVDVASPMRIMLDQYNRDLYRQRKPRLRYRPPPDGPNDFSFGVRIVDQRLAGQKTLFLDRAEAVRAELGMTRAADATRPVAERPPLACLFWAVAEMDLRQPQAWRPRDEAYRAADARGGY